MQTAQTDSVWLTCEYMRLWRVLGMAGRTRLTAKPRQPGGHSSAARLASAGGARPTAATACALKCSELPHNCLAVLRPLQQARTQCTKVHFICTGPSHQVRCGVPCSCQPTNPNITRQKLLRTLAVVQAELPSVWQCHDQGRVAALTSICH